MCVYVCVLVLGFRICMTQNMQKNNALAIFTQDWCLMLRERERELKNNIKSVYELRTAAYKTPCSLAGRGFLVVKCAQINEVVLN